MKKSDFLKLTTRGSALLGLGLLLVLAGCGAVKPYIAKEQRNWQDMAMPPSDELMYSVFLIGDGGDPDKDMQEPALRLLESQLRSKTVASTAASDHQPVLSDDKKAVVFLGDNIYLDGLSAEGHPEREEEERIINEQLKIVDKWEGMPVFIPGNHDWKYSSEGGLEAVIRQGKYIENYLQRDNVFLPKNGCPGPVALPLGENVVMVVIDSEWWLTKHRRPEGPENGCGVESELDLIVQLDDMLNRLEGKHIVLSFHHPVLTNGNHGGHYSLGDHIFPLRLKYPGLYIPLPVIGSIYPLARMYGASRQDLPNPKYQALKNAIMGVVSDRPNVVIATGHDHNLQLLKEEDVLAVVSGAGCKENYCVGGGDAFFVHKHTGFARLNYYKNGEAWIEFWVPEGEGETGRMTFRMPLYALSVDDEPVAKAEIPDYTDSVKVVAADPNFGAKTILGRWLMGEHYREVWRTPVKVKYLDMERDFGGLTPVKLGGGKQTVSLRVLNPDSVQYTLRSVDKNPAGVLPEALHSTFVESLVNDQLSSAHPYGALTIPRMAKAIGVYHTNPALFYVPTTPSLGVYLDEFGGRLATVEIRPDEDLSKFKRFGYTENAVSTRTMLEKIREDNDDEIAQREFLRARLFDMLLGDWDRHQDQWRWAEFEKEDKGSVYHPIPRDRDQVYVKFDGFLPWLGTRKWAVRNIKSFGYEFEDMVGLNLSAVPLDRRLTNELDAAVWEEEAKYIQTHLSDEVIEAAIRDMPEEVFAISGPEIIAKLKSRRADLAKAAINYYRAINEVVDVVGSDKHERFEIERLEDGSTRVVVHKTKKEGDLRDKIYERTFDPKVTKEIRIYGLAGHDKFLIRGQARRAIKLRIIGGPDADTLRDESQVQMGKRTVLYYDDESENSLEKGSQTRIKLDTEEVHNSYDPEEYNFPYFGPRLSVEYNVDDGLFLGGGVTWRSYKFRRNPASRQTLLMNYAFATQAYNFRYRGEFLSLLNYKWDFLLDADVQGPQYVLNYFGQGNETPNNFSIDYYRTRFNRTRIFPRLRYNLSDFIHLGVGPQFTYVDVSAEHNKDRIIDSDDFIQSDLYEQYAYMGGAEVFANIEAINHPYAPTRGLKIRNSLRYTKGLRDEAVDFWQWTSDFMLYISPNIRYKPTFSVRLGGQRNWGDFLFYQSATIGQDANLRGFRRNRFAGYAAMWQNTELRIPLSNIRNYLFTGNWGVYGFLDHARVWAEGENSDKWHRGYGPGIFLNLYQFFVVTGNVSFSEEGPYMMINGRFFF